MSFTNLLWQKTRSSGLERVASFELSGCTDVWKYVDLCLFIPSFPALFDLLISLGQQELIILPLKVGPACSKWPKVAGILVHSTKSLQSLV